MCSLCTRRHRLQLVSSLSPRLCWGEQSELPYARPALPYAVLSIPDSTGIKARTALLHPHRRSEDHGPPSSSSKPRPDALGDPARALLPDPPVQRTSRLGRPAQVPRPEPISNPIPTATPSLEPAIQESSRHSRYSLNSQHSRQRTIIRCRRPEEASSTTPTTPRRLTIIPQGFLWPAPSSSCALSTTRLRNMSNPRRTPETCRPPWRWRNRRRSMNSGKSRSAQCIKCEERGWEEGWWWAVVHTLEFRLGGTGHVGEA
jgi:hypothetical protein